MNDASTIPPSRQPDFVLQINLATPKPQSNEQSKEQTSTNTEDAGLKLTTDDSTINVVGQLFRLEIYAEQPLTDDERANVQNWLTPTIVPLITMLHQHLSLQLEVFECLCLVESPILGEIIYQVQREKGLRPVYTGQEGYYHTAAKTVSYLTDEGKVKSTVICNFDIFGKTVEALRSGKPYSEWEVGEQLSYYVLAHEVGHVLDAYARKDVSVDETVGIEERDWEKISAHYAPMLFHEHLACVLASESVTAQLQTDMLDNWHEETEHLTSLLNRKRLAFASDVREIAGYFWIVLLQLAKLLGHDRDDEGFPAIAFGEEEWEELETIEARREIVAGLSQTLIEFRSNYPDTPSEEEITKLLTPYFLRLAASYGYYLREEDFPSDDPYEDNEAI